MDLLNGQAGEQNGEKEACVTPGDTEKRETSINAQVKASGHALALLRSELHLTQQFAREA